MDAALAGPLQAFGNEVDVDDRAGAAVSGDATCRPSPKASSACAPPRAPPSTRWWPKSVSGPKGCGLNQHHGEVTRVGRGYARFRNNDVLSDRFGLHLTRAGIRLAQPADGVFLGSSDIGDVSSRAPAIHPIVAILGDDTSDHTLVFARAVASERGREVILAVAGALACTAVDVLSDTDIAARAWARQQEKAAGH
ncbi:hypothetical protein [Streptomyces sp. CB03578]|uniref:hypothetical protein n=1 Tax=Streptomyces sp. CB03578 TaxID=1718987 RepID=UPI000A5B0163|nr:hypothetical protein [Streptomyces sp. CB03578]